MYGIHLFSEGHTITTTTALPGLALFEVPPVTDNAGAGYALLLDNAVRAESLGYETYWVAEGRFSNIGQPSALTLLAVLSERTDRLRLGTAVIPLAFDHPQRLAETAAVVNTLSGDRLELGVGKRNGGGFSAAAYDNSSITVRTPRKMSQHAPTRR